MRTSGRRLVAAAALVSAFGLAACGDDDDDDDAALTAADLDGRTFRATDADGHTLVSGTDVTISFTADRLSLQTGCNVIDGEFTIDNGRLLPGELISTLMACEPDLTAQEQWLGDLLEADPEIDLDGDGELELSRGEDSVSFDEVR